MTDPMSRLARRRFLQLAVAGAAAVPMVGALTSLARAQEQVSEDDEIAAQLGYKHDASEVDPSEWPEFAEGNICANCGLYDGAEGEEWGPCQIFGGNLVAAAGWCQAWIEIEA